ncbi:MAG: flagellar export chaperone FliS [Comamonadaceae bacterium]|nr:flagellar export chaperone FliS [Comamonadaceae bacterium]
MFSPFGARSASAYQQIGVQSVVTEASPHQLINMLFEGLLKSLQSTKVAMEGQNVTEKIRHMTKAQRILQEGLIFGLDLEKGGELAENLLAVYDYCMVKLTQAHASNDVEKVEEVIQLIDPIAKSWAAIGPGQAAA